MNTLQKPIPLPDNELHAVKHSHHDLPNHTVTWKVEQVLSQRGINDMTCVYFDDLPVQRLMVSKVIGKMWFKDSSVFDTSANTPSPEETERIASSDVIITDINDTNSVEDPSGWLRRGKMALEAWKIVIFVSGNLENKEVIDNAFLAQYKDRYVFLAKPYELSDISRSILELIAQRNSHTAKD